MNFTDIFVKRPVLASVVSLVILVLGLRSLASLEVRQYPELKDTVVTVSTSYPGASSELIKGFITTPLQQAIAQADGIDYISSTSRQGRSIIEVHMHLNFDPNAAVSDIQAKVASQRSVLPSEARDPVITSKVGATTSLMYIAFHSDQLQLSQITDYVLRVAQPRLQSVSGVGKAALLGTNTFAMRIWLDPKRMSALDISPQEISAVLRANNYLSSTGSTRGNLVTIDLSATTDIASEADFNKLVVGKKGSTIIRLRDVADVELGSEGYSSQNLYSGAPAVFLAIDQTPGANPLDVAEGVHLAVAEIRRNLPEGVHLAMPYDASVYIKNSIDEVFTTLAEAVSIVLVVIFLSLGSLRAAIIPAITVPLSLIGGAFLMLLMGFSLNLLTMLSMILAIGLVVDDAIIVVENIHRHIEKGKTRVQAAMDGARELALPVIAMTTTLVAVYAPIGFMGGLVGTLFTEFTFSLAATVLISGVVALTLAPMISSKVLAPSNQAGRFEKAVEHFFERLTAAYARMLHKALEAPGFAVSVSLIILISLYPMYMLSKKELSPLEDQNVLITIGTGPQTATLEYLQDFAKNISDTFKTVPEYDHSFILLGLGGTNNRMIGGFKMPPQSERARSQMEVQPELQAKVSQLTKFRTAVVQRPSLPGAGGGLPIQFLLLSDAPYDKLDQEANKMIGRAMQSGNFIFLQKDVEFNRPRETLVIDRDRAADLGISMADIGQSMSTLLGDNYINRFSMQGRSYKVIPQVSDQARFDTSQFDNYYLKTSSGEQVPLTSIVKIKKTVEPSKRTQFQQLNSLTIQGIMRPGTSIGAALEYLEQDAAKVLPRGYSWDYTGSSRQFMQQGTALLLTFAMSMIIIYLVLSAQFESWRDPFIIMVAVPLSLASAMAFIMLGFASMNIYTQVGLITLIGLIAKNGILIVEFANQLQVNENLNKRQAVEKAASIRLRPILMTTVSMIVAMIPLLSAAGPGAVSRFHIGLVISTGLGIGTLLTLFVIPAFYLMWAHDHHNQKAE